LEGETPETLQRTAKWAISLGVDTAQFQVLIPFEGTPLYRSLAQKGFLKNGYPDYPGLPTEEIQRFAQQAYRKFYLQPVQLWKMVSQPRQRLWHYLKVAHKVIPNIFFHSPKRLLHWP